MLLTAATFISVNAHAEELRSKFVAHDGKKELVIEEVGTRYTVDFGLLAKRMAGLLKENVSPPKVFRDRS